MSKVPLYLQLEGETFTDTNTAQAGLCIPRRATPRILSEAGLSHTVSEAKNASPSRAGPTLIINSPPPPRTTVGP